MAFETDIYKSASYPYYDDSKIGNAYCARSENMPSQTWYGHSFGLLLEYMTNFISIDTSEFEYIGSAFRFTTTNFYADKIIYFNTYTETINFQEPYYSLNLVGTQKLKILYTNVRLFWGWGSMRKSDYIDSKNWLCNLEATDCGAQRFIHMNPDWVSTGSTHVGIPNQFTNITLKKDTEYIVIFHKDTLDNAGINKPQFWAVLNNTNEMSYFDIPLQKYSGAKECERVLSNKWNQSEMIKLKRLGFPISCGVPPANQNVCGY